MHNSHDQKKYTCPMHPEVLKNKPGMCPICGMNLLPTRMNADDQQNSSLGKHEGHKTNSFLAKFWAVIILTIPILLYSELFEKALGVRAPEFYGSSFFILILGSIVYFYGGMVFLVGASREIRARLPGMMTLIALAITAAYVYSVFSVLHGAEHNLFWELSTLIAIMLLGHWVEMKAVVGAQGALGELAKLLPDSAEVFRNGATVHISITELKIDDLVLVKPGAKIPADGKIIEGRSDINESIITGESKPVFKKEGDEVIAGGVNGDGSLKIRITKIGEHTFLAGVMRLVAEAQASKSRLQIISDRAALYLTAIAITAGGVTFISWLLAGAGVVFATERLVAVLVIACPHALGLAVPLVASISTTMAARNGFLVKQRLSLEVARNINVVLFDKTGTLTKGEFGVSRIVANDGFKENEVLSLAASVNSESEHPLAKSMVLEARSQGTLFLPLTSFKRVAGKGAEGFLNAEKALVGNEALMADSSILIPSHLKIKTDKLSKEGKTVIFVALGNRLYGAIALADIIREESREAVASLKKAGIRTAMVTGDSDEVAKWVAEDLGIDEYFAKVLPHEKSQKVKLLQRKGNRVGMVGDGINDAPALTQADLGIAIGAGTNVAIESAGVILVKNDPRDIPKIIHLSKLTYAKMIQNLFWATGYNIIALPLAAGVLAPKGIILEPAVAAVLMSVSTVVVAFNALLLRRRRI